MWLIGEVRLERNKHVSLSSLARISREEKSREVSGTSQALAGRVTDNQVWAGMMYISVRGMWGYVVIWIAMLQADVSVERNNR